MCGAGRGVSQSIINQSMNELLGKIYTHYKNPLPFCARAGLFLNNSHDLRSTQSGEVYLSTCLDC